MSFVLTGLVDEHHRIGFRFKEEERLFHELDTMSIGFDCASRLTQELVTKFIERKPNWHQRTQEQYVHAVRLLALYMLRHNMQAFVADYSSVPYFLSDIAAGTVLLRAADFGNA